MPRLYSVASSPRVHPAEVASDRGGGPLPDQWARPGGRLLQLPGRPGPGGRDAGARLRRALPISRLPEDGPRDAIMVGPGHRHRALPRLRAGAGGDRRHGPQLAFLRRPAPGDGFSLRGGVGRRLAAGAPGPAGHGFLAGSGAQGLCPGPDAGERRRTLALDPGRGRLLRLRRREAHGQGRRHGPARHHGGAGGDDPGAGRRLRQAA